MPNNNGHVVSLFNNSYYDAVHAVIAHAEREKNLCGVVELIRQGEGLKAQLNERVAKYPIGREGRWMTIPQIANLGMGMSEADITEVISTHRQFFPISASTKPPVPASKVLYGINHQNIGYLDKIGASTQWIIEAAQLETLDPSLKILRTAQSRLEATCSVSAPASKSVSTAHPNTSDALATNGHGTGYWLTYAEIMSHSNMQKGAIYVAVSTHKGDFSKDETGPKTRIGITKQNYRRLGLSTFPPAGEYETFEIPSPTAS